MRKLSVVACLFMVGCATTPNTYYVDSYAGSIYYNQYSVQIVSDPPGAKIEWNNDLIGVTPLSQTFNGYQGMFAHAIVKAYPVSPGQYVQTKILPGNQPLPRTIYFDMNLQPTDNTYNVNVNP